MLSDALALERDAHTVMSHCPWGPYGAAVHSLGAIVGQKLVARYKPRGSDRDVCQVLVTLAGIGPPIWRRLLIPSSLKLDRCHLVFQGAFGWTDSHLHMFRAGDKAFEAIYDRPEEYEGEDEGPVGFYDLLHMGGGSADYIYDYGDNWVHRIELEQRTLAEEPCGPLCLDGARAAPPEDVGGIGGYRTMLEALADPHHEEHQSYSEWLPQDYDAEAFSVESSNAGIRDMLAYRADLIDDDEAYG